MTTSTPRPEPNDSEPGDSDSQVRAREPAVTGLPAAQRVEMLSGEFCRAWDGTVAPGDVLTVISIAVAACRILAIVVPLFMRGDTGRQWFTRQLHKASRRHFRGRSEVFHESFAAELAEFVWALPDNGVSRGEIEAMLSELKGQSPDGPR